MFGKAEHKYHKNWFENNFMAIPAGIVGNCSACVFRNAPVYCKNMACTYYDSEQDFIESVYWLTRETHANILLWTEFRNWVASVPTQRIRGISNEVMSAAVKKELEKTR